VITRRREGDEERRGEEGREGGIRERGEAGEADGEEKEGGSSLVSSLLLTIVEVFRYPQMSLSQVSCYCFYSFLHLNSEFISQFVKLQVVEYSPLCFFVILGSYNT
jgi:hypothetical protein